MTNFKKIKFAKYSNKFPDLFKREKRKLKKILPKDSKIEHCGSTAVPGLGGKGIIDIFACVQKKQMPQVRKKIQKQGYIFIGGGGKLRDFFEKHYNYAGRHRRVHLHVTPMDSFEFKRAVAFVCHLKKNPEDKKKYVQIKKKAVKHSKGENAKYREYKSKFIQSICKKLI